MRDVLRLKEENACHYFAKLLSVNPYFFLKQYHAIDHDRPDDSNNWSMPKVEAKLLYACAKATCPQVVLELGTYLGYSTRHFWEALRSNGRGVVVTLDHFQRIDRLGENYNVIPLTCDGVAFAKTLGFPIDLLFVDGDHEEESTYDFLSLCLPHVAPGGLVLVHDVCYEGIGDRVSRAMERALGDNFVRILVGDSPCGLGVWRKPLA